MNARRLFLWLTATGLIALAGAGAFFASPLGKAQQAPRKSEAKTDAKPKEDPASESKSSRRRVPVIAEAARTGDIEVRLGALGTVTPLHAVTVRTRIDSQLVKVLFREGQMVKEGDLLAQIDARPFRVQLAQAEAQAARDRALLDNARLDLERYRVLLEQDSVSKQQLDTQDALVRQYEGVVAANQAAIDNAKLQITYCDITAPVSGRVGLRQVDAGNMVRASDANGIVTVTQLTPIAVVFSVPEDRLPAVMKKLRAGESLHVEAYDRAGKVRLATGTLLSVDNQIDPTTGTVKLKAAFANADQSLFPNQFVNVRMLVDVQRDAVTIPEAAVQRGAKGTYVYAVQSDKTVDLRPVALGAGQDGQVAVIEGLKPDELVVTDGADRLREGIRVEVISRGAAAAQDGPQEEAAPKKKKKKRDAPSPSDV